MTNHSIHQLHGKPMGPVGLQSCTLICTCHLSSLHQPAALLLSSHSWSLFSRWRDQHSNDDQRLGLLAIWQYFWFTNTHFCILSTAARSFSIDYLHWTGSFHCLCGTLQNKSGEEVLCRMPLWFRYSGWFLKDVKGKETSHKVGVPERTLKLVKKLHTISFTSYWQKWVFRELKWFLEFLKESPLECVYDTVFYKKDEITCFGLVGTTASSDAIDHSIQFLWKSNESTDTRHVLADHRL